MANKIYDITESFPAKETYALSCQMQRAAVSVMSNIAEGLGRFSDNERRHFLDMANGSLMEISSQLEIAELRHYIDAQCLEQFDNDILVVVKQLAKLRAKFTLPTPDTPLDRKAKGMRDSGNGTLATEGAQAPQLPTPNTQHPTPNTYDF